MIIVFLFTHDNRLGISNVDRSKKKRKRIHLREPKIQLIIMEMMDRPVGNPYLICWRKYITRENDDLDSDDMQYLVR